MEARVVIEAANLRPNYSSSLIYAVITSWKDMVEVSDANATSTKNAVAQTDANGMPLKISGKVTNTSEGPSEGSRPALNTAGNITKPARTDTKIVSKDTFNEVDTRLLSFLK